MHKAPVKIPRSRKFAPQRSYEYDRATTNETEAQWKNRMKKEWSAKKLKAKYVVLIFHNQDMDKDGNLIALHVHAIVYFNDSKTWTEAQKALGTSSEKNTNMVKRKVDDDTNDADVDDDDDEINTSWSSCAQYLLHITPQAIIDKKHLYNTSELIFDDIDLDGFKGIMSGRLSDREERKNARQKAKAQRAEIVKISNKIRTGEMMIAEAEQIIRFDKNGLGFDALDWRKNKGIFLGDEDDYRYEQIKHNSVNNRPLASLYISGIAGIGKNRLARPLALSCANGRGIHKISAKGKNKTFDIADGYDFEKVAILQEVKGYMIGLDEFCSVFDPMEYSLTNSRHKNKPWLPNFAIFVNSAPLDTFIDDMYRDYFYQVIGLSKRDRHNHSLTYIVNENRSKPEITGKIREVRRRFTVNVHLRHDDNGQLVVDIYVRADEHNYAIIYKSPADYKPGEEPFFLFKTVSLNFADEQSVNACVDMIREAVRHYYTRHNYDVKPENI